VYPRYAKLAEFLTAWTTQPWVNGNEDKVYRALSGERPEGTGWFLYEAERVRSIRRIDFNSTIPRTIHYYVNAVGGPDYDGYNFVTGGYSLFKDYPLTSELSVWLDYIGDIERCPLDENFINGDIYAGLDAKCLLKWHFSHGVL
jgi:hypothetical protein